MSSETLAVSSETLAVSPATGEIGSEFHWDISALQGAGPTTWLPERHELFATGCGAMSALLRRLGVRGRVHLPSYFCMGVAEALSADTPIAWYRHLPDGRGPHWETLHPAPGDVVIAQNLFGREDGTPWHDWIAAHPRVTVLEDHSHDPFGEWARGSSAAYAVASLRKTLPLPDGGLLWSPQGRNVPHPAGPPSEGGQLKLAAMLLKAAWLEGRPIPKPAFRELQQRGEHALLGSAEPASALTAAVLPVLDVAGLRSRDAANVRALLSALPSETPYWRAAPGGGAAPFRVPLVCVSEEIRDALLGHLARHGIFAPVHWRQDRDGVWSGDDEAAGLAARMLTLPVDHRCDADDVSRLVEVLGAFDPLPLQRAKYHRPGLPDQF